MNNKHKYNPHRNQKTRFTRDRFFLSVEGSVTEVEYFKLIQKIIKKNSNGKHEFSITVFDPTKKHKSSPDKVLERMEKKIKKKNLQKNDEAWLVVDRNSWDKSLLMKLERWANSGPNYFLALSNPNFEYWLLLHFNPGNSITNKDDCLDRLKKHLPNYNKHIDSNKFNLDNIKTAISNSKNYNNKDIINNIGRTTVRLLVNKLVSKYT